MTEKVQTDPNVSKETANVFHSEHLSQILTDVPEIILEVDGTLRKIQDEEVLEE